MWNERKIKMNKLNNKKINRITIRFTNEDLALIDRVVNHFEDLNISRVVRTAVRTFCPVCLHEGKFELNLRESKE